MNTLLLIMVAKMAREVNAVRVEAETAVAEPTYMLHSSLQDLPSDVPNRQFPICRDASMIVSVVIELLQNGG